jgi:hypothetical protein
MKKTLTENEKNEISLIISDGNLTIWDEETQELSQWLDDYANEINVESFKENAKREYENQPVESMGAFLDWLKTLIDSPKEIEKKVPGRHSAKNEIVKKVHDLKEKIENLQGQIGDIWQELDDEDLSDKLGTIYEHLGNAIDVYTEIS